MKLSRLFIAIRGEKNRKQFGDNCYSISHKKKQASEAPTHTTSQSCFESASQADYIERSEEKMKSEFFPSDKCEIFDFRGRLRGKRSKIRFGLGIC